MFVEARILGALLEVFTNPDMKLAASFPDVNSGAVVSWKHVYSTFLEARDGVLKLTKRSVDFVEDRMEVRRFRCSQKQN